MLPQTIELCPPTEPVACVIVLHGLGADGTDFLPLADQIDLAEVGPVRWVLPRAAIRNARNWNMSNAATSTSPRSATSSRSSNTPTRCVSIRSSATRA